MSATTNIRIFLIFATYLAQFGYKSILNKTQKLCLKDNQKDYLRLH